MQIGSKRKEATETSLTGTPADLAREFLEQTLGPKAKKAK